VFILDEPYVSEYLKNAVIESGLPVLDTPVASHHLAGTPARLLSAKEFAREARKPGARIYSNSENAIGWIAANLADTDLPRQIVALKDKARFRELLRELHPEFYFAELCLDDLDAFDPSVVPKPFVIKPAVGFFSVGVHVVESDGAWPQVARRIRADVEDRGALYPGEVLEMERFIIEEVVQGEEFAVDAYYRENGEPVVVDIMEHLFASGDDVSDRVYYTSPALVEKWREPLGDYLREVGRLAGLHDFPVHAELRVDSAGRITPIEINPMRFGGWCAADMAWWAFGQNPYAHYLADTQPDWSTIATERSGSACGLIVADIAPDVRLEDIVSVDYEGFVGRFSQPVDLRRTDFNRQPVFAFLFVAVPGDDMSELDAVLHADLGQYLRMR
jgi:hypothetical protein